MFRSKCKLGISGVCLNTISLAFKWQGGGGMRVDFNLIFLEVGQSTSAFQGEWKRIFKLPG